MKNKFYVTTPIYYVNAEPHIGHAYSTIVADVINRFYRLCGYDTFFQTGTDEHGEKIVAAAEALGQTPEEYVNMISNKFRMLWPELSIEYDNFIRTTDPLHKRTVELILNRVNDKGDIYFSEYEGLYCVGCERFYTKRELVDGKCPDHKTVPEPIRESNYFFRMSNYQDWLIDHIKKNPDFIRPERYRNEVLAFLREPLDDLCISRPKSRLTWGITLPFDDNFVTYVWFDALINYLSGLGYPDGQMFVDFWPSAQHIIAKDILKPHGIYWPCMLKSAGIEPYQHLNVHGYWNVNRGKMSKSIGNVINPLDLVKRYGVDTFRYFVMRDMVFGLDSEFSEDAFIERVNADLANDLGNLVSRTFTMVHKYFKGVLPDPGKSLLIDDELKQNALALIDHYEDFMKEFAFHKALMSIWEVIGEVNRYIDKTSPWVLAKSDTARLATVLCHVVETIKVVSVLMWPFMPGSSERIEEGLGLDRKGNQITLDDIRAWGNVRPVKPIHRLPSLFPRIERKKDVKEGHDYKQKNETSGEENTISFEDFQKVDLRIGTIKEASMIPKARKLVKLTVDIGEERTVVAGIAGDYDVSDLVGRQVLVVANLAPVKLMGVKSYGMIIAAKDDSGLHLLSPDTEVKPGSKAS